MKTPKILQNKSSNDSETVDDMSVENSKKENTGRRLQDNIISKDPGRKLNLDRRVKNSERRADSDPNYNGPARRLTIDRRLNLQDFLEHFELTLLCILHPRYNSILAENRMDDTFSLKITDKVLYI